MAGTNIRLTLAASIAVIDGLVNCIVAADTEMTPANMANWKERLMKVAKLADEKSAKFEAEAEMNLGRKPTTYLLDVKGLPPELLAAPIRPDQLN